MRTQQPWYKLKYWFMGCSKRIYGVRSQGSVVWFHIGCWNIWNVNSHACSSNIFFVRLKIITLGMSGWIENYIPQSNLCKYAFQLGKKLLESGKIFMKQDWWISHWCWGLRSLGEQDEPCSALALCYL